MTVATHQPTGTPLWRAWAFVRTIAWRFYADGCLLHASALTYTSLLSMVPLLALTFAMIRGFGARSGLDERLLVRFGLSPEAARTAVGYAAEANVGTLTTLGVVALLFTAISVLGAIEGSLNHIWRVRTGRLWWRKITDYLSVVLLTPFLLLGAVGMRSFLAEQQTLRSLLENRVVEDTVSQLMSVLSYSFNILTLAILYVVMPNRRPHFRSIGIAALIGGIAWQLIQTAYVHLQIGVVRANVIYGALAQLPVTLVWIYVSWAVVLAAAELAAVIELGVEGASADEHPPTPWVLGLELMLRAAEQFGGPGGAVEPRRMARDLGVSADAVEEIAARLSRAHLLLPIEGTNAYALARDPATVDLAMIAAAVEPRSSAAGRWDPRVERVAELAHVERGEALRGSSLSDLVRDRSSGALPAPAARVVRG